MHSKYMFLNSILTLSLLASGDAAAEADRQLPYGEYQLNEVTISLIKVGGFKTVYEISGTGKGRIRKHGFQRHVDDCNFEVTSEIVVDLISAFYGAYFFDLANVYTVPYRVSLKENGAVQLEFVTGRPSLTSIVMIQIGQFKKTSQFSGKGPPRLMSLAKQIETISESGCAASASNS